MGAESETEEQRIARVLRGSRTIAVVGLSPRPERDSHRVALYLQQAGYRVIPVNPAVDRVLGETSYPTLDAVPEPIDMVDVFRRSEDVPEIAEAAIRKGVRSFWMQLGVSHEAAAERLRAAGIDVVENRCTKIELARLSSRAAP
jgi:predicted CoA-binding protein